MKYPRRPVLLIFSIFLSMSANSLSAQSSAPDRASIANMLEQVTPAVVNIAVTGKSTSTMDNPLFNDPFFRRFFEMPDQVQPQPMQSVGSGVIIDAAEGYILTNHHVVENAEVIEVILNDRRSIEAMLVGSDKGTDVALLKVKADGLVDIPLADSDSLRVGDFVVAIGNPFGIGQTVTTGIVSALDRSGINADGYEDFIQTDASINPGNSGGALVDYNGQLIGINTAIITPGGGNVGIGFAVPINMASSVVEQLIEYGEIQRAMLGVRITDLTPDVVDLLDLDVKTGAIVSSVEPQSPAELAGIKPGDVIVRVNDVEIDSASLLRNTIGLMRGGTQIEIELYRDDVSRILDVILGSQPDTELSDNTAVQNSGVLSGARFSDIPVDHPMAGDLEGVLVTLVEQGSKAWRSGLRQGDIITRVNQSNIRNRTELVEIIQDNPDTLAVYLVRENQELLLIVR